MPQREQQVFARQLPQQVASARSDSEPALTEVRKARNEALGQSSAAGHEEIGESSVVAIIARLARCYPQASTLKHECCPAACKTKIVVRALSRTSVKCQAKPPTTERHVTVVAYMDQELAISIRQGAQYMQVLGCLMPPRRRELDPLAKSSSLVGVVFSGLRPSRECILPSLKARAISAYSPAMFAEIPICASDEAKSA